jgi:hypothetical protein
MFGTVKIKPYDNIEWFLCEYAPRHNWDKKTAYKALLNEYRSYNLDKKRSGDLVPILRQHVQDKNLQLLEWFDSLLVLI